jgi:4-amino-4-deoxy-L-arabinose transferase-like glycosyltransferase
VAAVLAGPLSFSLETASRTTSGSLPTAGPSLGASGPGLGGTPTRGGPGSLLDSPAVGSELVALLNEDAEQYTWVAAGVGSQTAAGYQLATGHPVMPIGGFNGSDPSPTLEQFQQWVADGRIHWFIGSSGGADGMGPGGQTSAEITSWVEANYSATTVDGVTVYDLTA